ncbi:hypothetical protein ACT7BH_002903 [Cronobacter turicensis]
MSISLSVFFNEPVIIDVCLLASNANKIFNLLLGTDKQCLKVEFFTSNGTIINKIKPDSKQLYNFIESNIIYSGGYLLYYLDEYWEYHSDKELYEFSFAEIDFDKKNTTFVVILSLLIAAANYYGCEYIYDTSGIFSVTREYKANIGEILDLRLTPDLRCVNEACNLLCRK